jgi:hypothetical protein
MAIEWMIGLSCEPKAQLGLERLVAKAKGRRQAEALLETMRANGDARDVSEISIRTFRQTPDGTQVQTSVSLAALFANAEDLTTHAKTCEACTANQLGRTAGCYGAINYPIARDTEAWLLSLLPEDLHFTAGTFLLGALQDFSYDGAPVARLRNGSKTFFEEDEPAVRTWEDGTRVDANQLLQMMFFVGAVQPSHALMLALFLGLVPHQIEPNELRAIMNDEDARKRAFGVPSIPPGPSTPQIEAMRTFLSALCRSALLVVPLGIDA